LPLVLFLSFATFGFASLQFTNISFDFGVEIISVKYPFVSPVKNINGTLARPKNTRACSPLNEDWTGYILLIDGDDCYPETKAKHVTNSGSIGAIIIMKTAQPLQNNLQYKSSSVPIFSLYGSFARTSWVDTLKEYASLQSVNILVTPDEDPDANPYLWIITQIIFVIFSIFNVILAARKSILFYRDKGAFSLELRQIVMIMEVIVNGLRAIFFVEPYPIGGGIFPYPLWCIFSTWSLSLSMISTLLIIRFWAQVLENVSQPINSKTHRALAVFIIIMISVCIVDLTTTILRAALVQTYLVSIITSSLFLVFELALVIFFFYHGFRLMQIRINSEFGDKEKHQNTIKVISNICNNVSLLQSPFLLDWVN